MKNEFEKFQDYLLSGSAEDEGLTLQEQYDNLMKQMDKYPLLNFVKEYDLYSKFPQLKQHYFGNWKPDPEHILFPQRTARSLD